MRTTIEEKIIATLCSGSGKGVKNLSRHDRVVVYGNIKNYYLWGSLLFWNDVENVYYFSARGHNLPITQSRLNAILLTFFGASIVQKDYKWILNWNDKNYPINETNIFSIKNNKLYCFGSHEEEEVKPL